MIRDRKPRRRTIWVISLCCALAGLALIGLQLNRAQLWEERGVYTGWHVQAHILTGRCRLLDRTGVVRASGTQDACSAALVRARADQGLATVSDHLVVLLHGMGRSPWIFKKMEAALRQAGYETVAVAYPSLTRDLDGHADHLQALLDGLGGARRVSFVTHSLGGIVLREALAREAAWQERLEVGRVVMLAPPNQGSELASALDDWRLYHAIGGPSAGQMVKGSTFAVPPPRVEIGIIAGGQAGGKGFNPFLSADNDGIVTVAETELQAARDWLVVPAIHTLIASHPETIAATLAFLEKGRFR